MQFSFFEKQMDRLRKVYSSTSLNEERVKVLWARFENTPGDTFERAVNHLIGEFTTSALPALSRISEAVLMFGKGAGAVSMNETPSAHFCEPCRDFGFDFQGDVVVACKRCINGKQISPQELARQQKNYDRGAAFLKRGMARTAFLPPLPYNPAERVEWT